MRNLLADGMLNEMREAAELNQLDMHRRIDWEHTEAFAYGNMGRVFINLDDRYSNGAVPATEYESVRDALVDRFESITDPETGKPLVERAIPTEELYEGPAASGGGDIVLVPTDWRYTLYGDFSDECIHHPTDRVADHDPSGIIILSGSSVADGSISATVADVAPTLLGLHDLPLTQTRTRAMGGCLCRTRQIWPS